MKNQNKIKLAIIVVLTFIVGILLMTMNNKANYVNFEYEIEKITHKDRGIYLTFCGDETNKQQSAGVNIEYVIYEFNVDLSVLSDIQVGDIVKFTVEDNYGKFDYTIIYEMEHDGKILFNIMEKYSELDANNKIVFISFLSCMILYLVVLCIYKGKIRENTITDFVITNPTWQKYLFIGLAIGSLGFILPFSLLYAFNKCEFDYFCYSFVFYIFLLLGIFGIYVCFKEKFVFENETFSYHKLFAKTKSAHTSNIKKVLLSRTFIGAVVKVNFCDNEYNDLLSFLDDGSAFKDDLFVNACKKYDIPINFIQKKAIVKTVENKKYDVKTFIKYIKFLTKYNHETNVYIVTKKGENFKVICRSDFIEISKDNEFIKSKIEDISNYVDFNEKLNIVGDLDFSKPLEGQVEIIKEKLWFIVNSING